MPPTSWTSRTREASARAVRSASGAFGGSASRADHVVQIDRWFESALCDHQARVAHEAERDCLCPLRRGRHKRRCVRLEKAERNAVVVGDTDMRLNWH